MIPDDWITIRIFDTRQDAENAQVALKEGGITSYISEDQFNYVPIQEYGVPARFRLNVHDRDFPRTVKYLGEKLKAK